MSHSVFQTWLEGAIVRRRVIPLTAAVTLIAATAGAQTAASTPEIPDWDVTFSLGVLSSSPKDEGQTRGGTVWHGEALLDLGHYWTQHLKTEAGISFLNQREDYDFDAFPVAGLPDRGYSVVQQSIRLALITPALTYQFGENEFAHPYVSGGARIELLDIHSRRYAQTFTQNRTMYSVPALDRTDSIVVVRPVVAAGFKSYFNERTFIRTEVQASIGADHRVHPAARVGFGLDF